MFLYQASKNASDASFLTLAYQLLSHILFWVKYEIYFTVTDIIYCLVTLIYARQNGYAHNAAFSSNSTLPIGTIPSVKHSIFINQKSVNIPWLLLHKLTDQEFIF